MSKAIPTQRSDTIYRAVSEQEFKDISTTKMFRSEPRGFSSEGKYFAEQASHARKWGNLMEGEGKYRVVRAQVPRNVPYQRWSSLDRIGPARFYEGEDLLKLRYKGEVR